MRVILCSGFCLEFSEGGTSRSTVVQSCSAALNALSSRALSTASRSVFSRTTRTAGAQSAGDEDRENDTVEQVVSRL
jgi:hypothetical protein